MSSRLPERVRSDVERVTRRGLRVRDLTFGVARVLRRTVPFDGVCLLTIDPASGLPTGEVVRDGLPETTGPRMAEIELGGQDVNSFSSLARSPNAAASLSAATGGELDRSVRHHELRAPHGFGDELRVALVTDGAMWGGLTLLRTSDRTAFTAAETDLVEGLAGPLAEGVRRSILAGGGSPAPLAAPPERPPLDPASDAAGLVLLGPDNSVAGANDAAQVWLAELQEGRTGRALPPVVTGVVSRARGIGDGSGGSGARARVRTAAGTWLVVRALTTGADPQAQVAVILEPARSTELAALLADLLGLTARERAVTELVAQGLPTSAIAARLHLSPWTVQDHLKAVFDKTATSTRGELVARLYFDHGAPRLTTDPPLTASGAPGS